MKSSLQYFIDGINEFKSGKVYANFPVKIRDGAEWQEKAKIDGYNFCGNLVLREGVNRHDLARLFSTAILDKNLITFIAMVQERGRMIEICIPACTIDEYYKMKGTKDFLDMQKRYKSELSNALLKYNYTVFEFYMS